MIYTGLESYTDAELIGLASDSDTPMAAELARRMQAQADAEGAREEALKLARDMVYRAEKLTDALESSETWEFLRDAPDLCEQLAESVKDFTDNDPGELSTTYDGFYYEVTATDGDVPTSGSSEPSWNANEGAQTIESSDGTAPESTTSDPTTPQVPPDIRDRYGTNNTTISEASAAAIANSDTIPLWSPGTLYQPGALVKPPARSSARSAGHDDERCPGDRGYRVPHARGIETEETAMIYTGLESYTDAELIGLCRGVARAFLTPMAAELARRMQAQADAEGAREEALKLARDMVYRAEKLTDALESSETWEFLREQLADSVKEFSVNDPVEL